MAGFIKGTTRHCCTQHIKDLGYVVSEKIFYVFSHSKYMGANDSQGKAIFDSRGMIGRIYIGYHETLLHAKYSLALVALDEKTFYHSKPVADIDTHRAWSIWTTGAWLAGFKKGTTKHCYIQNIEALGLLVSE